MSAAGQAAGVRTGAVEALARLSTPFQRTLQRGLQPPAQQTAVQRATRALAESPATTATLGGVVARQIQPEQQ
jgi:hypothetical protein